MTGRRRTAGVAGLLPILAMGGGNLANASQLRSVSSRSGASASAYVDVVPVASRPLPADRPEADSAPGRAQAFGGFSRQASRVRRQQSHEPGDDAIAELIEGMRSSGGARQSSRLSGDIWRRPPKGSASIMGYRRAAPYCDDTADGVPGDSLGMCSGPAGTSVSCETSSDSTIQSFLGKCTGPPGGSNSDPTDIALSSTTVNQSGGVNATVGTLSTTDADGGDTHTYSLVAGTGDGDNASFNISGSNLRADDASSLPPGNYSVRIQTADGNGGTYQESFTVTVVDDVAPGYENSTPSVSGTTVSQTTLTVRLSEIGTAYYVAVADGDGAPSSVQVKAGQDSGGSAAIASGSINVSSASQDFTDTITGLDPGTAYDIYAVAEDDEGTPNLQGSPVKVDVTTDAPDSDGDLTAAGGVSEPVGLATTVDTAGEAVNVFDFTLSDGGTSDGLAMVITDIVVNVSGTTSDAVRDQVTWRLNGNDASNVTGTYNAGADTITFSGLSIAVADGGSETYTLNAYYNDNTGLTEDDTFILSVDGDTDVTLSGSGTVMGVTSAVTNGAGGTVDVTATGLGFTTQPAGATSGSALSTQPVVAGQDGFGNTDADFTETITVAESSAGTLAGDVDIAAVNGVATFTDLAYTATADQESFTLTANDEDGTGDDFATVDSNAVTADVVATMLEFSTEPGPTTVARGDATSFTTVPVVRAVDANATVDTGYSTDIQLAEVNGAGSAILSGTGDQDGSAATVTVTPSSGVATFTGLTVTYTPSGGGAETFNLQASSGGLSTVDSTTLTANQEPAFNAGGSVALGVVENSGANAIDSLLAVTDADSGDTLTWTVSSAPSKGSLSGFAVVDTSNGGSVAPSGLTYTPDTDTTGADAFQIQVSDGLDTDTIAVDVNINAPPTVTIGSSEPDPTNVAPFDVSVTFSEPVTGFDAGDVSVGNGSVGSVSGTGASYTVSIAPAGDGTVTVDVPAGGVTDADGAGNDAASPFTIDYDGTAPAAPSALALAAASDTGSDAADGITSDTTPTITGTAEADSAVSITSDQDGALGDVTADGSGNWSFTPGSALSEATHSLTATAEDAAGNQSTGSPALSVTIDTTAPAAPGAPDLAATSDTGDSDSDDLTNDATPTLTGTAEADAEIEIVSDQAGSLGTATADGAGAWSFTPGAALSDAVHGLTAKATDAAGNASGGSSPLSVTVDTAAPALAGTKPADNASNVDRNTELALKFDTPVLTGPGSGSAISVHETVGGSVHETVAVAPGDIAGNTVTVSLTEDLVPGRQYHVLMAGDALVDEAGNAFAGIADAGVFDFTVANAAPVAAGDNATTAEDERVAIPVLANDTDADSALNPASVRITAAPSHGRTRINTATGVVTYIPAADYAGTDTFSYTVTDIYGASATAAAVDVAVTAVNDVPVAVADAARTDAGTAVTIDVAGNDTDADGVATIDPASIDVTTSPLGGSVQRVGGQLQYTPETAFTGSDRFSYRIADDTGARSNVADVVVEVGGGAPPTLVDDKADTDEDTAVTVSVLANDSAATGALDPASAEVIGAPRNGDARVNAATGAVTYTPAADFAGSDSFTYRVRDGDGAAGDPATVTVQVAAVNDPPAAAGDTVAMTELTARAINVLGNDHDVDGSLVPGSVELVQAPAAGAVTVDAGSGVATYTPGAGFGGSDSFTYRVRDDKGAWSGAATVTITGQAGNEPPYANDDFAATDEDDPVTIAVLGNDGDADGAPDAGSVTVAQSPAAGSASINGDGSITYTPDPDTNGEDRFTYTVADGVGGRSNAAAVTVRVDPVNDAPTIAGTPAEAVRIGEAYEFAPVLADADGDRLRVTATGLPGWASLDAATGIVTGSPAAVDSGVSGDIVLTVSDGTDTDALAAFTIEVLADLDGDGIPDGEDADIDGDGIPNAYEQANGLDPRDPDDANGDADGDGATNGEEYSAGDNPQVDDQPPQLATPDPVVIDATGLLTARPALTPPSAVDALDGAVEATLTTTADRFAPGRHVLTWSAVDAAGNRATVEQRFDVQPLVSLAADQVRGEGTTAHVRFLLNGESPSYPLEVAYTVDGTAAADDHDLTGGTVVFEDGMRETSVPVTIAGDDRFEGPETIRVALDGEGNFGDPDQHVITIVEDNAPPEVTLSFTQDDRAGRIITRNGGPVTVAASVDDPNAGDSHSYEWLFPASALVTQVDGATRSLEPGRLEPGVHPVRLIVRDDGNPIESTTVSENIRVVAQAPSLSAQQDSDGDGVDDATEGFGDDDGDGQPNYLDGNVAGNVLSEEVADGDRFLIESQPGTRPGLGEQALAAGDSGAGVASDELAGGGVPEDEVTNVGGYFDFRVNGVPIAGDSIDVVIPQRQPVPEDAVYRKFVNGMWVDFLEDVNNALASATGEEGVCPPPGSDAYRNGLIPGDWCVQLTIEDGGPNDADGLANGAVVDPGGVGTRSDAQDPDDGDGDDGNGDDSGSDDGGGGGAIGYLALLLMAAGGLWRNRRRVNRR